MKSPHRRLLVLAAAGLITVATSAAFSSSATTKKIPTAGQTNVKSSPDVSEIDLHDFFKMPIGPQGLEPTAKLLSLNNQRVRLVGYQVKEEQPSAGIFMLASAPVSLSEQEDGPADDLPAATVFVHMPVEDAEKIVAYRAGLWSLTGTLQIGNQEEKGGRVSYVRLLAEKPKATASR